MKHRIRWPNSSLGFIRNGLLDHYFFVLDGATVALKMEFRMVDSFDDLRSKS